MAVVSKGPVSLDQFMELLRKVPPRPISSSIAFARAWRARHDPVVAEIALCAFCAFFLDRGHEPAPHLFRGEWHGR